MCVMRNQLHVRDESNRLRQGVVAFVRVAVGKFIKVNPRFRESSSSFWV